MNSTLAARRLSNTLNHLRTSTSTMATQEYTTRIVGAANTLEHRVYLEKDGNVISPFQCVVPFHRTSVKRTGLIAATSPCLPMSRRLFSTVSRLWTVQEGPHDV